MLLGHVPNDLPLNSSQLPTLSHYSVPIIQSPSTSLTSEHVEVLGALPNLNHNTLRKSVTKTCMQIFTAT